MKEHILRCPVDDTRFFVPTDISTQHDPFHILGKQVPNSDSGRLSVDVPRIKSSWVPTPCDERPAADEKILHLLSYSLDSQLGGTLHASGRCLPIACTHVWKYTPKKFTSLGLYGPAWRLL